MGAGDWPSLASPNHRRGVTDSSVGGAGASQIHRWGRHRFIWRTRRVPRLSPQRSRGERRHSFIGERRWPVEASERHRFDVGLQDQSDRLRMIMASLASDASAALAAPDALRAALLGLEVVVADAERMSALRADGLLRGSVDPNESVAVQRLLPSVSLSSTAREGPAKRDEPSRARSAAREPLTAGSPV